MAAALLWSRQEDSNPQHADYDSAVSPLSYAGICKIIITEKSDAFKRIPVGRKRAFPSFRCESIKGAEAEADPIGPPDHRR